jgi:1-phosphofructokinase family hexose kinase
MLLVVSPNLCLDRIVVVRRFTAGQVHRAESVHELASGKGLNVARASRRLGVDVTVVGIVGDGHGASAIIDGARAHGVALDAVRIAGPVRVCTLIIDPGRHETVINEPGPSVGPDTMAALLERFDAARPNAGVVVLAGSLPPGMPATVYGEIIRRAGSVPVILDAAGDALRLGIAARPFLVKANRLELSESVGRPLAVAKEIVEAGQEIERSTGARVLITLGAEGAVLVTADGRWRLAPPDVERVSSIGAGDSLTAGLVAGMVRGLPLLDAARIGIAAAAADVTTLLPGTIDAEMVQELTPQVRVENA